MKISYLAKSGAMECCTRSLTNKRDNNNALVLTVTLEVKDDYFVNISSATDNPLALTYFSS
jgi:hypothetical protein